jgi:N-acetylglucosamine kinase-like BadF-type ATPase
MNLLAIDGGASSSKWCIKNPKGKTLSYQTTESLSGHIFSQQTKSKNEIALRNICSAASRIAPISTVIAGISGLDNKSNQAVWMRNIIEQSLEVKDILIADDLFFVYLGLALPGKGILVYAGTGCIGYHLTEESKILRAGGYGYLIDDIGGGFWIGQQALKLWLRNLEKKTVNLSILDQNLVAKFDSQDWSIIREKIYTGGRKIVASVAKEVHSAAISGDTSAKNILNQAGLEIGQLANRLFKLARLEETDMYLVGGITNCAEFIKPSLTSQLHPNIKYCEVKNNNVEIMANAIQKYGFKKIEDLL